MPEIAIHQGFGDNPLLFADEAIEAGGFSFGRMSPAGTTFVAVQAGEVWANGHRLTPGMYAAVPEPGIIRSYGACVAMLATVKRYRGIFSLGGPIEDGGRLRYIDGCTDTGLIQPLRQGDPCLNYLHFPPGIRQSEHHHPSHRIGLIYAGSGLCHTRGRTQDMLPGSIFVLPAGEDHFFETFDDTMRIIAFHPDSEFGPTDESHQMLNATLMHR